MCVRPGAKLLLSKVIPATATLLPLTADTYIPAFRTFRTTFKVLSISIISCAEDKNQVPLGKMRTPDFSNSNAKSPYLAVFALIPDR
jgi:hypothetical protein